MDKAHDVLIRNLGEHTVLAEEDITEIRALTFMQRDFEPNEDFIRQGDKPEHSALVVSGMVLVTTNLLVGRSRTPRP